MVALLLFYPYSGAAGRLDEADEYQAKTALLYNFAKLVTWPEDAFGAADAPFCLCHPRLESFRSFNAADRGQEDARQSHRSTPLPYGRRFQIMLGAVLLA